MKNQLLLTIAFLGVITFASAQTSSTISFDASGSDDQTFTVGQQDSDDLNDVSIVTVAGDGIVNSNNKFFGIIADAIIDDGATGAFVFEVTTSSASTINTKLTLDMAKRPGCSVKGKVSVTGYTDVPFDSLSNGTDETSVQEIKIEFGTIYLINTDTLTVTITLEEMLNVDNTSNPIFRLENVLLEKDFSTAVQKVSTAMEFSILPNPVVSSFQINAEETIENVRLFNTAGSLIKTFKNVSSYDISDLAAGMYLVDVKTLSGSNVLRVVKK